MADGPDRLSRMTFDDPTPLPTSAQLGQFTPDASSSWCLAYAGPCGDDECNLSHTRLYLLPMIGWLHYEITDSHGSSYVLVRPAFMGAGGTLCDFLHVPQNFQFIAVLRASPQTTSLAKEIYRKRFGNDTIITDEAISVVN